MTDDDRRQLEAGLLDEIVQLGHIVDEQEQAVATLRHEILLHRTAIGWRLQLRLEGVRTWMLKIPVLRQVYRTFYRALEIWVDEGFLKIFVRTGHKVGMALRGRRFLVEDRDRLPRTSTVEEGEYDAWIGRYGNHPDGHTMEAAMARFPQTPLISVLTVLEVADGAGVRRVLATLQAQAYERWELCVALPLDARARSDEDLQAALGSDPRLIVVESALGTPTCADAFRLASGDFIGLLEVDDELAPDALFEVVMRLGQEPSADIIYSDEDSIGSAGGREEPLFKPDWSPDLLLSMNYVEHFGILRRRLVEEVGGFAPDAGRGESYDLVLRLSEKTDRIVHVPKILSHRRRLATTADTVLSRHAANRDECRALVKALGRRGYSGRATPVFARSGPRCYATRFDLRERPLVSIIIPTRNKKHLLETTLESIWTRTDYDRFEIIVVDNGSTEPDAVEYLASLPPRCQVYQWSEPFNYSAVNNFGVQYALGELLLFLNNDVEVIRPDWLTALVEHAQRPEVGAVGARLLYADGRIQHAGVVVGINRAAANAFRGWYGQDVGRPRLADLTRNCSAVTGACMMVPRRVFDLAGGFDPSLRVVLNDVDLCLKIRQRGYLVVYTPHALLYHYEGSTRGLMHPSPDQELYEERWSDVLAHCDPYYNPNLTHNRDDWSIRI